MCNLSSGRIHSNRFSFGPALSPNGNKLAFHSNSDFFGQGNTQSEIWLYDTLTLTLTRITTASASNRDSASPSLNEDGTKIAFYSDSDFLNQGIPDDQFEVWVYDLVSKTYTRATTASDSSRDSGFNNLFGNGVHISPNGKKIVFSSDSDFLNQGILDNQHEIWLYDLPTSHLTRVTTTSDTSRYVGTFSLNKDGTKIALMSDSDYLSQGILQSRFEIWLYSTANMTLTRITTTTGSGTHRDSYDPALNYDGTKIVFASSSDFLNQGIPDGQSEIWLYNTQTMTYTRITTGMGNGIRASYFPSPSANGEKIAFNTDADFFNQGIITNQLEIWLYDSGNQILPTYKAYFPLILKQAP